ncbi:MAG: cytidylate kinase-like family protein [Bacteroidales bacterium]|jgi:cytidylate kinase|nr:cytidylate kinase-like family protein [Bacteroidales bacterium]
MEKKIIINIGRQFGGGGLGVAYELGKKLGIPVYDKELIAKAAQDSGFSKGIFEESDEKKRLFSLSSIFASRFGDTENYMSDRGLFKMQSETIRKIAEQGSAIIVGRCSDYILRDMECTLDVFLTSPLEVRAARIAERSGLSLEEAEKLAEEKDRNRAEYYNYYTFTDWGVASTYDLCLDSSVLGIEGTADMIIEFARKAGKL